MTTINIDPKISEKTIILGTDYDWTFLRPKIALTWRCSNINYLNRHRGPIKVV